MSEITNISSLTDWRAVSAPTAPSQYSPLPAESSVADTFEMTPFSKALLEASGGSSLRFARLSAIRGEIQAGTFETGERLEGTVSRLIDLLG